MSTVALAYAFTCLGFCLGFVVAAIFRVEFAADTDRNPNDPPPPTGYQPRAHRGSSAPPPRRH